MVDQVVYQNKKDFAIHNFGGAFYPSNLDNHKENDGLSWHLATCCCFAGVDVV